MSTATLTGARWSSAVRCITKAQHEALGTPREDNPPPWLDKAFARGFHVGEAWALIQSRRLEDAEHDVHREMPIGWGLGWTGHADLADETDQIVYEAYHSKTGEMREEKALQAAGYAHFLGEDWRAVLIAIDATDVEADGGFAVKPFPVNVDGLRGRVMNIKARVETAFALGEWNPADRVSDTPKHPECQTCPFLKVCHANYEPPAPEDVFGLETQFQALRVTDADRKATSAALKRIEDRRRDLIEEISEYVPENQSVTCGDVTVKRTTVKGGVSFSLTDALKAGHALPAELEAFVKTRAGYDKWDVAP